MKVYRKPYMGSAMFRIALPFGAMYGLIARQWMAGMPQEKCIEKNLQSFSFPLLWPGEFPARSSLSLSETERSGRASGHPHMPISTLIKILRSRRQAAEVEKPAPHENPKKSLTLPLYLQCPTARERERERAPHQHQPG